MMFRGLRIILLLATLGLAQARAESSEIRILDGATARPVAGATLIANGHVFSTDTGGNVRVPAASGPIFVRAPGYLAVSLDASENLPSAVRLTAFTPKALYLSVYGAGSRSLLGNALALATDGTVNALVIDVKGDSGLIPYPSAIALARQDGARRMTSIPDLAAFVARLHALHLYAIARVVTFKDMPLASARPDLAVHRADGSLYRDREAMAWTDPFQPEVRAYNIAVAVEAARAGFDEIQLDYLRFPDAAEQLRFSAPVSPAARIAAISGFLAQARQALLPYNTYIAADIFGYVCWNHDDTGIGQTLGAIAPDVDYLSPMLYPSGFQFGIPGVPDPVSNAYDIVYLSLEQARARLNLPRRRLRPWLQAFRDYAFDHRPFAAQEVAAQTRAADDFGSDGWMLWNPRNDYGGAGLEKSRPLQIAGLPSGSACY